MTRPRVTVFVMAEPISINLTGINPSTVHIHLHVDGKGTEILARLTSMENIMSELSDAEAANTQAIADLGARIDTEVNNLTTLFNQALAADVADQATITDLRAQLAAVVGSINASTAQLQTMAQPAAPPVT